MILKGAVTRQRNLLSRHMRSGLLEPLDTCFAVRVDVLLRDHEELYLRDEPFCPPKEERPSSVREQTPELFRGMIWRNPLGSVRFFLPFHEGLDHAMDVAYYGLNILDLRK